MFFSRREEGMCESCLLNDEWVRTGGIAVRSWGRKKVGEEKESVSLISVLEQVEEAAVSSDSNRRQAPPIIITTSHTYTHT